MVLAGPGAQRLVAAGQRVHGGGVRGGRGRGGVIRVLGRGRGGELRPQRVDGEGEVGVQRLGVTARAQQLQS